jgi:predicted RND superfamily exporter protein
MVKSRGDQRTEAFARWVIRFRFPVMLLTLLAAVVLASGGRFLSFASDYRVFFSQSNPQMQAFEALQDIYTKNDNVMFVVTPQRGDVFTRETLAAVEALVAEGWTLPFAIRVDGLTNYQHTAAAGDELVVGDLIADAATRTDAELAEARRIALEQPVLVRRLIADDARVTGVSVTFQLPGEALDEVTQVMAASRALAERVRAAHPDIEVRMTGTVPLNHAFTESSIGDMQTLVPMMFAVIAVVMWLLLRSIGGTIGSLLVVALSAASAMGLAGWLGFQLSPPSAAAPTMILTLAVADSIHVLVTMLREMRHGRSREDAIVESLRLNMGPVFLTSLTTVIGFLSMNFSEVPPFNQLGNIVAIGVTLAFVYSVLFLPAFMAVVPLRVRVRAGDEPLGIMDRMADVVIAWRRPLLWGGASFIVLLALASTRNEFNDRFVQYFDERVAFRVDSDYAAQNLTGIYQVEFSVGAGESGGISDPAYLAVLDRFEAWYRQQPGVKNVSSFGEVMKRLNKSMHGDEPDWYRVPDSRELAAQYLLLYEMSLPFGLDLNNQINVDKSATRFTVTLADMSSNDVRAVTAAGERWLMENAPPEMHATGASPAVMFAHISDRNIRSMLLSVSIAMVLISLALIMALRSVKFGLLSIIPNIAPAFMAFGVWGLFVGEVNVALSVVASMTLGIVVDDTIHFMSKYMRARREKRLDPENAVRYAFSSVGMALVVMTIVLTAGFLVLAQSSFEVNGGMARLTAITIVLALGADLLFLPPLLMALANRRRGLDAEPARVDGAAPEAAV